MPSASAVGDLKAARELRAQSKNMKDSIAKARFDAAAVRLERRAGQKASKVGKPTKKRR